MRLISSQARLKFILFLLLAKYIHPCIHANYKMTDIVPVLNTSKLHSCVFMLALKQIFQTK